MMACCLLIAAAVGVLLPVILRRRGHRITNVRVPAPSYVPAVLEATQVIGYPEGQLPTPDSRGSTPQEEKLDHGRAQAQNVAREYP